MQVYTNCDQAELFLNGEILGTKSRVDFASDNIIKWLVHYRVGELRVLGYRLGRIAQEYFLRTSGEPAAIRLSCDKSSVTADRYDVVHASVQLLDNQGREVRTSDRPIKFEVRGPADLLAVDNGWEMNVDSHYQPTVKTHNGRALAIIQSTSKTGKIEVTSSVGEQTRSTRVIEAK